MKQLTILITGANKGIGYEAARQLAAQGHHIILGCRDKVRGEQAIAQLKAEGLSSVALLQLDVSSEASVVAAYKTVAETIGQLDVLINNAGILGGREQQATTVSDEVMKSVFETNVFGVVRMVRTFSPLLRQSGYPHIVNVTSELGSSTLHSDPSWMYYNIKGAAYGPSKSALNAYTVALAYELRDTPFKVNAVNPGHTATDFNNHRGTKDVKESAALIAKYAVIGEDGPTGKFLSDYGETPW